MNALSYHAAFAASDTVQYPSVYGRGVIYLKKCNAEQGRRALFFKDGDAQMRITADGIDVGTHINEYGGKPYWLHRNSVYYVDAKDQKLYVQSLQWLNDDSKSAHRMVRHAVSPSLSAGAYALADVVFVGEAILAVVERIQEASENQHIIAACNADGSSEQWQLLVSGADFYSNLVYHAPSKRLAWVQWNHPNMPWDSCELYLAELSCESVVLRVHSKIRILAERNMSACQLLFSQCGDLFFAADFANAHNEVENYWNIYRYYVARDAVELVIAKQREFGYPHWQYGDARLVQHNHNTLLAIGSHPSGDCVLAIDLDCGALRSLDVASAGETAYFENLHSDGNGRSVLMCFPATAEAHILHIEAEDTPPHAIDAPRNYASIISSGQCVQFNTSAAQQAHGIFYPPLRAECSDQPLPPLIVMVHGGPTAHADMRLDLQKQFWTTRGFAVFDVNYRGSSGYGRAYRDSLNSQWGVWDIDDIVHGVQFLIDQSKVDAARICIRGKSAGGYAVLKALVDYPELFCAGSSYYGIGNLQTLSEHTHKFERHYTDNLIGECYCKARAGEPKSRYFQRSPIHQVSKIQSAMAIFQGAKDPVVPPVIAEEMVAQLQKNKLKYQYTLYPEEGHGFKIVDNVIDAHQKELAFYQEAFKHD